MVRIIVLPMALFLIAAATLVFASERTYNMRNVLLSDKYYQFKERVTRIESLEESLEDLVKDRDQKIAYINNEKRRIIEEYAGKWPESAILERVRGLDDRRSKEIKENADRVTQVKNALRTEVQWIVTDRRIRLANLEGRLESLVRGTAYNSLDYQNNPSLRNQVRREKEELPGEIDEVHGLYDTALSRFGKYLESDSDDKYSFRSVSERLEMMSDYQSETETRRLIEERTLQREEERKQKEFEETVNHETEALSGELEDSEKRLSDEQSKSNSSLENESGLLGAGSSGEDLYAR